MKTYIVLLSLAALCLTLNSPVLATVRKVPLEYPTIQDAIDAAQPGDTVIVEKGTYTGAGNKNLNFGGKAITVRSTDPNDLNVVAATVIDCENAAQVRGFYFHNGEGPNSIVSGFTIKRGYVYNMKGGGICCVGSSPTIKNCTITNNKAQGSNYAGSYIGHSYGGGISCTSSSHPTIVNCTISDNTTSGGNGSLMRNGGNAYGGGIYSDSGSNLTIINCVITENTAIGGKGGSVDEFPGNGGSAYGGGTCIYGELTIVNCMIADNTAIGGNGGSGEEYPGGDGSVHGGGTYCGPDNNPTIRNCTITGNEILNYHSVDYYGAGICSDSGTTTVLNSIIWGNYGDEIYGSGFNMNYCDIEGGHVGTGNIDADPCFIDPAGGVYHLLFGSPCIDAGDPNYVPLPGETDIDGHNRIIDGRIDIGADEFNPEIPFLEISPDLLEFEAMENGPNPTPQIMSVSNSKGGILTWAVTEDCSWMEVYPESGQCTDEVNEVVLNIDISGLAAGFYNCELTINADGALNSPQTATATLRIYDEDGVLKVPSDYSTIQAAIDAAQTGDVVIVAEGTYTGAGNKNLDYGGKAIMVRSIDPEDPCVVAETVIDCQNSGRGFYFHSGENANSVLAGFTIKRGKVTGRPAKGGGIYCSGASPTIKNCVITSNLARGSSGYSDGGNAYGGGVYCESNNYLALIDCTVNNSRAIGGNGGDEWCSPMSGCTGRMGRGGNGYGGGVYISSDSSLTIVDCIISDNSASGGKGGIYYETGAPMSADSGGTAIGGGIFSGSAATVISNCSILNNTATGGQSGVEIYEGGGGTAFGGGIYGQLTMSNCRIQNNISSRGIGDIPIGSTSGGGGICSIGSSSIHNCLILDNIIHDFHGGSAIYRYNGSCLITNCTISGNTSVEPYVAIYTTAGVDITDSIIWGHGGRDVSGCSVTYSCIEQNVSGTGNIHDNPRFVTGPLGDYYLSQIASGQVVDSSCVDTGSDTAANLGMDKFTTRTDELKDTSIVDMGYHYPISPGSPDIYKNLHVDWFDYSILAADWQNCNEESCLPGDITKDTCVNGKDLKVLAECWLDCYVTKANHPQPAHQTKCVDPDVTLSWVPGEGALLHDVYFSTDANAVACVGHLSSEFMGTVSDPNFKLSGLELRTTYFWRIDEVGPACTTQGVVWNFKTYDDDCSPKAWWKFDEGSGNIVYDSAGTNDGTIYGAAWTTGQIDGALDFDGVDDYVLVSDSDSISVGNRDYTICAWIYPTSMPPENTPMAVVSKVKDGADKEYYLSVHNGGLRLGVEMNSNNQFAQTTTSPVTVNSWHFIVVAFDSSITTPTFYHNGQIQPSDNIIDTLPDSLSDDLYIGLLGGVYQSNPFDGMIDDVRIYNRVLSAGEIWQLYQDGLN